MVHACRARAANELVATLLPSNQVLVEGVYVLVGRDHAIDAMSIQRNPAERARELFAVAGHHQESEPVVVQFDFGDVILTEEPRGHTRGVAAADEELTRVFLD